MFCFLPLLILWSPFVYSQPKDSPQDQLYHNAGSVFELLSEGVFGQTETIKALTLRLRTFVARQPDLQTGMRSATDAMLLLGLPGIGISEMVEGAAQILGLPLVTISIPFHIKDSPDEFADRLEGMVKGALQSRQATNSPAKCILKIEGLQDLKEDGAHLLPAIHDFLGASNSNAGMVFVVGTVSLNPSFLGQHSDPRIGSFDELARDWKRHTESEETKMDVLEAVFGPRFAQSFFPITYWVPPLDKDAHTRIVQLTLNAVVREQGFAPEKISITPEYLAYLAAESVIPIQGARQTSLAAKLLIERDLESARIFIPNAKSIRLNLDFNAQESTVVIRTPARRKAGTEPMKTLLKLNIDLRFPPLSSLARMSEDLLETTIHEFGHAYVAARMGLRFSRLFVKSPVNSFAGVVYREFHLSNGRNLLARVYMLLGSRAMERVFMAPDPRAHDATMHLPPGSVRDIEMATEELFQMIFRLGYEHRTGVAAFDAIRDSKMEALSKILRTLEDALVDELLQDHSLEWYRNRIVTLARAGMMDEGSFYNLIDLPVPSRDMRIELTGHSRIAELFPDEMVHQANDTQLAPFLFGDKKESPRTILDRLTKIYLQAVTKELHRGQTCEHSMRSNESPGRAGPASSGATQP